MYWVRFFLTQGCGFWFCKREGDGRLYMSYFDTSVSLEYSTEGAGV